LTLSVIFNSIVKCTTRYSMRLSKAKLARVLSEESVVAGGAVSDSRRSPPAMQSLSFRALLKTPNSKFLDKGNMEDADLQDIVHFERVVRLPLRSKIVSGNRRSGVLPPPITNAFWKVQYPPPIYKCFRILMGDPVGNLLPVAIKT
jgi:hypothetical protein